MNRRPIEINLTASGGRPIDELNRQIDRRIKVMGQSARYVVAAVAITALKSLRAATRKGKGKVVTR